MPPRMIVIGAGPIGIAAALESIHRGYDVTVLEAGEAGDSLLQWGSTRFFSPFGMNVTRRMRDMLNGSNALDDALLTGREMVESVLRPIAQQEPMKSRLRTHHRVLAIGRRGLTREEYAGHPLRDERPFRLLVDTPEGEQTFESEIVLDATGGYRLPKPFGAGGLPARGESRLSHPVLRSLGELESRAPTLRGKRILLVGHGHSAANAIAVLAHLAEESPSTRITWAVRTANRRPCEEVANDPLPERRRVVVAANDLAQTPPPFLRMERRTMIEAVEERDGSIRVTLSGGRSAEVDAIAAFTGYRPDGQILSELAVELSPVTEGGARLQRALANVTDCLNVPAVNPRDLESGESNFYFIGSRAYGRARTFLLRTGLQQLETILEALPR